MSKKEAFLAWIKTRRGIAVIALGSAIFLLLVFITLAMVYTMRSAAASAETSETSAESSEKVSSALESSESESSEESSEEEDKLVFLSVTTVQNDLRIRFHDENSNLISGEEFEVAVQKTGEKIISRKDTDKDGKIDLTNLSAGNYTVTLQVPEGFVCEQTSVSITVKDQISYEVLEDIKDEIKDSTEVNIQKEDTKPKPAEPEPDIKDTVDKVESTEIQKDGYEAVDISKVKKPYGELVTVTENTESIGFTLNYSQVQFILATDTPSAQLTAYLDGAETTALWTSNDTNVVTVDDSGKITAIAAGSTTVTATSEEKTASCKITVLIPSSGNLVTVDGKPLYIKVGNSYQRATFSDYSQNATFYVETTTYVYTGWQTIGGKTYYYDKDGNYVTGDQIIGGVKYTFDSNGVLTSDTGILGIDVSVYQGNIDWQAVKASGIEYVIIRCGFRGYGSGVLVNDANFRQNLAGAKAAGLKVGIYFFSQAINEVEAVEEASACISLLNGTYLEYPIFIDVENSGGYPSGRADSLTKSQRTAVAKAFCKTVQNAGYRAGVYANTDYFRNHLDASQLSSYCIWLAQYAEEVTYTGTYNIWQYTSQGTVPGISGYVDMNLSYYH